MLKRGSGGIGDVEAGAVETHYTREGLAERLLQALRDLGVDVDRLTPEVLAPVDEFHVRGREATEELAERVGLAPGQAVLDVGCGLGGTARYLAARHGVVVTGSPSTPR